MTDSDYVRELTKLAVAFEANEISQHEWKEQMACLRERRIEGREKAKKGRATADPAWFVLGVNWP